jgi:hypothetical protein
MVRRYVDDDDYQAGTSVFWTVVTALVMASWLGLLIYLSTLWRDRLDVYFTSFAQWGEDVMLGKKHLLQVIENYKISVPRKSPLDEVELGVHN